MRVLRTTFAHKHLLKLNPCSLTFRSLQSHQLFRRSYTANCPQEESSFFDDNPREIQTESSYPVDRFTSRNRKTWTIYNHVHATQTVKDDGVVQELKQSQGNEKHTNLSDSDDKAEDFTEEKESGRPEEVNPVQATEHVGRVGKIIRRKTKGKKKTHWVCSKCGETLAQWWAKCPSCGVYNTVTEFHEVKSNDSGKVTGFSVSENAVRSWLPQEVGESQPVRLKDVNKGQMQEWRIPLSGAFGNEVSRVLGGGLVPGCLVLVGGDPGVGKSTLLLQIAAMIAKGCGHSNAVPVLYVSGEESEEQIGNRADRLGIEAEELYLYSSTNLEDILDKIQRLSPRALVVDSIQTVHLKGVVGSAGGTSQVRECTSALLQFAKNTNIPVLVIGHVTKSGDIAGPHVLEHIVDVVLYMEGEKCTSHRLLRSMKNRFGSTDELGIFEMSPSGLQAVSNASEMFLTEQCLDSEVLTGLAVAVVMDGTRTFLIKIQALCVSASSVFRQVNGIAASKADMIIAVLMKQAGLHLEENGVFLNVVGGFILTETAGDLAIAAAICSSFLESSIPNDVAFIGEIGLGGELRMVPQMEKRVNTVAKLGYRMCIVPKSAEKALGSEVIGEVKVVGCSNLKEVIDTVFTTN